MASTASMATMGTMALMSWGAGQIGTTSHRTIAAMVGEEHGGGKLPDLRAAATFAAQLVWSEFTAAHRNGIARARWLRAKQDARTIASDELTELRRLGRLGGGYCIAGRTTRIGSCMAYAIEWSPWLDSPKINPLGPEQPHTWGVPNFALRLIYGWDHRAIDRIVTSGMWTGTLDELLDHMTDGVILWPRGLPIREAVDWVHTLIHTTIRGTKFAQGDHTCGGAVEIAAITTDRPFRWVCHKPLDSALVTAEERNR